MTEKYVVKEKQVGNYVVQVVLDNEPFNPRQEYGNDQLFQMVCFHSQYNLGDKHNFSIEEMREIAKGRNSNYLYLNLFLYDHSGITMSTTPFNCKWDSGQVGIICIEKTKIRKEYGVKRISPKLKAKILDMMKSDVKIYDQYLTGEVYGFEVFHKDDMEYSINSCWGFYDEDHCLSEGVDSAKWEIKNEIKKHINHVKTWIKNNVSVIHRYPCPVKS